MKKIYFIALYIPLCMIATNVLAQQDSFKQRLSLEAGAGYNIPVSPNNEISTTNFGGFRSFNLGVHYALNDMMGMRFTYGYNAFEDKDDSSMELTLHKFMAEGTFNIIQWIEMMRNPFEVMAHAGAGVSLGKSKLSSGIDKMGTIQVGVMPLYRITNNFSLHFDASYVLNIRQNYFYNGQQSNSDGSHVIGEYFLLNLGLGVSFGF